MQPSYFIKFFFSFTLIFLYSRNMDAQFSIVQPAQKNWNAQWIAGQNDNGRNYGVYYFRKSIDLDKKPDSFIVHISADNRYKLLVNDSLVSIGPARGDLYYWNYETIDLSPFLKAGKNTLAALVFNEAEHRPEAQFTFRTAFIMQGNTQFEEIINTNKSWKYFSDSSHHPLPGIFAASTGELIDMQHAIKDWSAIEFNDSDWPDAAQVLSGNLKGMSDGFGWMLVPSPLPAMEMKYQRIPVMRKATGIIPPSTFPANKSSFTVPANTSATMLLDQTYLTNAYVTLQFSKGKQAEVSLGYAESMYDEFNQYGRKKGNRNDVEGKLFYGRLDSIISDGSNAQTFTTLNFRTFRYLQLKISTGNEPLVIDDIYGTFTGYPFKQTAQFATKDKEINNILDIGWRTARLNAFDTYTDCPYYEQLQYIGDTRVQAMVSYFYSGDERLARNALDLIDHSRLPDGLTLSRYPSHNTQVISTFSLWYIGMLYDFWMYRNDPDFIKNKLNGVRGILDFFAGYQQVDGSLKNTPYWVFVDWANGKDWWVGAPPKGSDGSSAILDLQLLWAYQWAAQLEDSLGMGDYAKLYKEKAVQLQETIHAKYWDDAKNLYADTKEKDHFSQHANALALLTGLVVDSEKLEFGKSLLSDTTLTECTIYFKYYLHQALVEAGMGNDYLKWLDIWRKNIAWGLTTWTEDSNVEYTRSDCHAWGSSPNIEFFRTVLGVDSDAPGFTSVKIEPHLGSITSISGEVPHPEGLIKVDYQLNKGKWKISITLPQSTTGKLVWAGNTYKLRDGINLLNIIK